MMFIEDRCNYMDCDIYTSFYKKIQQKYYIIESHLKDYGFLKQDHKEYLSQYPKDYNYLSKLNLLIPYRNEEDRNFLRDISSRIDNISEEEVKRYYLDKLSKDFLIREEVKGKHIEGRNMRIDALIKPKDTSEWANKNIIFGIEFKSLKAMRHSKGSSRLVRQAIDYSYTSFGKYGRIPILMCPTHGNEVIDKVLNNFNVGSLTYTHRGLSIIFAGDSYIWNEEEGVKRGKSNKLITKYGSQ